MVDPLTSRCVWTFLQTRCSPLLVTLAELITLVQPLPSSQSPITASMAISIWRPPPPHHYNILTFPILIWPCPLNLFGNIREQHWRNIGIWLWQWLDRIQLWLIMFLWNLLEDPNSTRIFHLWDVSCVIDKAVPWNESWLDVDDGLWSMLSRFTVVNSSSLRVVGHTMPSLSLSITRLASSVDSCNTLSYDTDRPFSKRISISSGLRVLLWMRRPRYRTVSRSGLCLTALESLLLRLTALKTSNWVMDEAAELVWLGLWRHIVLQRREAGLASRLMLRFSPSICISLNWCAHWIHWSKT